MDKPCYNCREIKNTSDMEQIGVWVCKDCLENSESKNKKKKKK
jgi:hypothetical protein